MDLLLSDPDDDGLWKGVLLPPRSPFPPSSGQAAAPGSGSGRGFPQLRYWKSLLLDGALGACTPAVGERWLRSALRAVGGGEDGGDGLSPGARRRSAGEGGGEDDASLVSSAVVVLRGLSRLARSVFFFFCLVEVACFFS